MREWRRGPFEEPGEEYPTGTKPGATTLTQSLVVQRKARVSAKPSAPAMEEFAFVQAYGGDVRSASGSAFPDETPIPYLAAEGTRGAAGALPHLDQIQPLFGRHDVSHVRAHTDESASTAARAMGAEAYATGDRVAFDGPPSLHTAAHEAAHVVQQRAGVSLRSAVGAAGDAYEHHADAVADKVVRGESAETLLDQMASGAPAVSAGSVPVQAKASRESEADRVASDVTGGGSARIAGAAPGTAPVAAAASPSSWQVADDRVADVEGSLTGGHALPADVRQHHESRLGADLGSVRVHTDAAAARGADAMRAEAFATGPHVVFGEGKYAPGSGQGSHLLAHELAHVVQQGASGEAAVDKHNAADTRLPATQAEALTFAGAAGTAVSAAVTALGSSGDPRESNVPGLITQLGLTVGPLTPRHDSAVGAATITFFPGTASYAGSVPLVATTEHLIGASRNTVWIRARDHVDVDNMLGAAEIQERVLRAVTEVAHTHAVRQSQGQITTFQEYCARFNALYPESSFAALSDEYAPTMNSRGPKSERARAVFDAIMAQYSNFAATYTSNVGGIKEQVDRYMGPEGRNLLNSPGLQRLREAFFTFAVPVPAASYPAFRTAVTTAAQTLTAEDRAEVDRSNDWGTLIERHLTAQAQRDEIRDIIRTATAPAPPVVAPPVVAPPVVAPPVGGAVTPQMFVDSVTLSGPTAPVPAVDREVSVPLTPQNVHPNPAVAIDTQITVTPAASILGGNISPTTAWANASTTGTAYSPRISVTPGLSVTAQLALLNGGGLAPAAPIPPVTFTIDDQRLTNVAASWQPGIEFNNGTFSAPFVPGTSTPAYIGGAQTLGVKGTVPVAPNLNPGLTLSVRSRIDRGGATISPAQQTSYPANAAESTLMTFSIAPPSPFPATGDAIDIISELLDGTGAVVAASARTTPMNIGPEVTYTQAQAEAEYNADETHLHGAFIALLAAGTGPSAGLAGLIKTVGNPTGPIDIHPMVQRHDSAAYVTAENGGTPDPSRSAYVISTPPYAAHPDPNTLVIATGAGGWTIGSHAPYAGSFVLLSRTTDVATAAKRADADVATVAIHEAVHAMDRGTGGTPFDQYKAEFRAYWMDGRFGDPLVASSGDTAEFDPSIPAPGPKSARANVIFRLQYDDPILYPYCKPNYDANTAGFREQVDSYLTPDGINLNLSGTIENLRARFVTGVGGSFGTFRGDVQGFFGVGPPPPGGVLTADDRTYVAGSRAWRDLVDNLAGASSAQKTTLKTDMGIP